VNLLLQFRISLFTPEPAVASIHAINGSQTFVTDIINQIKNMNDGTLSPNLRPIAR
jgi:hypothetical protein